jgi:hypothetical protein
MDINDEKGKSYEDYVKLMILYFIWVLVGLYYQWRYIGWVGEVQNIKNSSYHQKLLSGQTYPAKYPAHIDVKTTDNYMLSGHDSWVYWFHMRCINRNKDSIPTKEKVLFCETTKEKVCAFIRHLIKVLDSSYCYTLTIKNVDMLVFAIHEPLYSYLTYILVTVLFLAFVLST